LHLGPTEFRLLCFLAQHPEHVFSREALIENVWAGKSVEARVVDVYVRRLRGALGAGFNVIRTVRGFGYSFEER
jgi:two-component system phosphate regulon response regulator PhoB